MKMHKEKELAKQMEEERKRSIKPSLRYLPEEERNELLTVRVNFSIILFTQVSRSRSLLFVYLSHLFVIM